MGWDKGSEGIGEMHSPNQINTVILGTVGVLLAGAISFLYSEVWTTGKAIDRIEQQMTYIASLQESREKLFKLEMTQALSEAKAITARVEATQEVFQSNFTQIWPRLRALDNNVNKINDALGENKVELVQPQKF